jgi:hypothetical protein
MGELPCTDDADSLATVCMSYHQQATARGESEGNKAIFLLGMIRIENSDTQRVTEDAGSLSEPRKNARDNYRLRQSLRVSVC